MEYNLDNENIFVEKKSSTNGSPKNEDKFCCEANRGQFSAQEISQLYFNEELSKSEQFVREFVDSEIRNNTIISRELYHLLKSCLKYQLECENLITDLETLFQDYEQYKEQVWQIEKKTCTEYGECLDGNTVSAMYNYQVAHFNQYPFDKVEKITKDLELLAFNELCLKVFSGLLKRTNIDSYLRNLCSEFDHLTSSSPVALLSAYEVRNNNSLAQLKEAISILFYFQRSQINYASFLSETRKWLEKLISVLLRVSTPREHLFILHHLLRCPAGVGEWGAKFIQFPDCKSVDSTIYLNHAIVVLAAILSPIQERKSFLQDIEISNQESSTWIVVDSDGVESEGINLSLGESDYFAFLNQVPFENMFKILLFKDDKMDYNVLSMTPKDILRSLNISSLLWSLLEMGLATSQHLKFAQFSKRIASLIKHVALYVTDHWQYYNEEFLKRCGKDLDYEILSQVQREYDSFICAACRSLYVSDGHIGWQYLATMPFNMFTPDAIWRLYSDVVKCDVDSPPNAISEELLEMLLSLEDDDMYYLLTAICNMALAQDISNNRRFVEAVCIKLFHIGFTNASLRDSCMKSCRILLVNLTNKYPEMMSIVVSELHAHFSSVGKWSMYLFKELPVWFWKLNEEDCNILTVWLLAGPLTSWESHLARYVISNLNWSLDLHETNLFIDRNIHSKIAMCIAKATHKMLKDNNATVTVSSSFSLKQVTTILGGNSQTQEQIFDSWAWKTVLKLRLHFMDQSEDVILRNSASSANLYLDIQSDNEDMKFLYSGISKNDALCCYLALVNSSVGHSIPQINSVAWQYCAQLASTQQYLPLLQGLQLLVPYFIGSESSLCENEEFRSVMNSLLGADARMKDLIVSTEPGPVLKQFSAMIDYQLSNYRKYNTKNCSPLVELWLRIFCSFWEENSAAVSYLMDGIMETTLFDPALKQLTINILSELILRLSSKEVTSSSNSSLSTLASWMPMSSPSYNVATPVSLLSRNSTGIVRSPYFTYFALHLEEYYTQAENHLWKELLEILAKTAGKANIDKAVKVACQKLKLKTLSSGWLAIYRWSCYALELCVDHPILPLYWHRFFTLYLQRIPDGKGSTCLGGKFFEGTINGNYRKRLKRKLQDCLDYFSTKMPLTDDEKNLYSNQVSLYETYLLWLEDDRLRDSTLYLPALPSKYNPTMLSQLFDGTTNQLHEYVYFEKIITQRQERVSEWLESLNRVRTSAHRVLCFPEDTNIPKRIVERLQSYDAASPAPQLTIERSVVKILARGQLRDEVTLMQNLAKYFQMISQYAKSCRIESQERKSIAKCLLDCLRSLYSASEVTTPIYASCDAQVKQIMKGDRCSGQAMIRITVTQWKLNQSSREILDRSDKEFQRLMRQCSRQAPENLIVACLVLEDVVGQVTSESSTYESVGAPLFYKLVTLYDRDILHFAPTENFFKELIRKLGKHFIDNNEEECAIILSKIVNAPHLCHLLLPHFNPSVLPISSFVHLYKTIVNSMCTTQVNLYFSLFSKFNVNLWLTDRRPKLNDRSVFIGLVFDALKNLGPRPENDQLKIHKVIRSHLCQILCYDFPEHYGEILMNILKHSETEKLSIFIWYDFLNVLAKGNSSLKPAMNISQICELSRWYATEQHDLCYREFIETSTLLSDTYSKYRLRQGIYAKYANYADAIVTLHSMVAHACVTNLLKEQRSALADQLCQQLFPAITSLFSPWTMPYFTSTLQEPVPPFLQQLSDDKSVLLPWMETDEQFADKMVAIYAECLKFIFELLPASSITLNNVCHWYILYFANQQIKPHNLIIIHKHLMTLPWSRFSPSLRDMEMISKIIDSSLPLNHSFLAKIFVEIPWLTVLEKQFSPQEDCYFYHLLFNLIVKISSEEQLKKTGKMIALLSEAQSYSWHLLDASSYSPVVDWFLMNSDSMWILSADSTQAMVDRATFKLLETASGFVASGKYHPTTRIKREEYIRAVVKIICGLASRGTSPFDRDSPIVIFTKNILDKMAATFGETRNEDSAECAALLSEFMQLLNKTQYAGLCKLSLETLVDWLKSRSCECAVLKAVLRVALRAVADPKFFGEIHETALTTYFNDSGKIMECVEMMCDATMQEANPLDDALISNDHMLTFYAIHLKRMHQNAYVSCTGVIHRIISVKPSSSNESKLALLWTIPFMLRDVEEEELVSAMLMFSEYLRSIFQSKNEWTFLATLRISKSNVPSLRCKILSCAIFTFIEKKLQSKKVTKERANAEAVDTDLSVVSSKDTVMEVVDCKVNLLENMKNEKQYSQYIDIIEKGVALLQDDKNRIEESGEIFVTEFSKLLYSESWVQATQARGSILEE